MVFNINLISPMILHRWHSGFSCFIHETFWVWDNRSETEAEFSSLTLAFKPKSAAELGGPGLGSLGLVGFWAWVGRSKCGDSQLDSQVGIQLDDRRQPAREQMINSFSRGKKDEKLHFLETMQELWEFFKKLN